jgi:hypothetical protein
MNSEGRLQVKQRIAKIKKKFEERKEKGER